MDEIPAWILPDINTALHGISRQLFSNWTVVYIN